MIIGEIPDPAIPFSDSVTLSFAVIFFLRYEKIDSYHGAGHPGLDKDLRTAVQDPGTAAGTHQRGFIEQWRRQEQDSHFRLWERLLPAGLQPAGIYGGLGPGGAFCGS